MAQEGLVGPQRVDVVALGMPAIVVKFEDRGGVFGSIQLINVALEANADEGEQVARVSIARPDDLVEPFGIVPAFASERVVVIERAQKLHFEVFALDAEGSAGPLGETKLAQISKRPAQHEPTRREAEWQPS